MPDSVLEDFTKETGIKVIMSTYDSNEALYAKIRMVEAKGYDLIVPSTDFVSRMRKEGLLQPLDKSKLTNLGNLDPKLMNQAFDPDNTYSVPYMWGSTAIAVNSKDPAAAASRLLPICGSRSSRARSCCPTTCAGCSAWGSNAWAIP
jgi:spermidine/putrescine transport system substrate-binding protein